MDINYEIDLKDEESDYQYENQEIETVFMHEEHDGLNQDGKDVENWEKNIGKDEEIKTEITNITNRDSITETIDDAINMTNDDNNENIQQINKFNASNTYINGAELEYKEHVTSYTDFIHITSNYNPRIGSPFRIWKTLPRSVLDVRASNDHKGGVFAVRYIPKGIRLGPIEGLTNTKRDTYYTWRFENGRLLYTSNLNFSNWPRFVNYASTKAEQNLTIFQHDRYLYFRTVKDINVDEELLVRYENILTENLYGQEYCVPYIERKFVKAQFCFYCNLGFKDEFSLKSHSCTVPNEISDFEIQTCHFCNLFTCERKYIENHLENCERTIDEFERKAQECNLIHISSHYNLNVVASKRSWKALPRAALTIKTSTNHAGGVFAVIKIPKDVIFGPYEGLISEKMGNRFGYVIENGQLVYNTRSNYKSWMRYINAVSGTREQNLTVFQNNGCLYFRALRDIEVDEELLYYLWCLQVVEQYGQSFCVPPVSIGIPKAFFCSRCRLGFGNVKFLPMHEKTCCIPKISHKEISTCPFCKVFACEEKYIANHIALCTENPDSEEFDKDGKKTKQKKPNSAPKNVNGGVIQIASYYNVRFGTNKRPWRTLPRSVLTIKAGEEHAGGVFAVIRIPNDVVLGPYDGLISEKIGVKSAYLFENGKLVHNINPKYTNWMRFVNRAPSSNEQNLTVFQYCDTLYFQTTRDVAVDEELLVFFAGIETIEVRGSMFLLPRVVKNVPTAYFCKMCRLGFANLALLEVHHAVCEFVLVAEEDVATCPFCELFICERKYLENHKTLCPDNTDGSFSGPRLTKEGKCRFCNTPVSDLRTHLTKTHNIKKKVLQCNECNFVCSKLDDLAVHKKDKCVVKDLAFDRNRAEDIELCDPGNDKGDRVCEEEDDGDVACEETPRKRWKKFRDGENADRTDAEDQSVNMSEEIRSIDDSFAHKKNCCITKDPTFEESATKDVVLCHPRRDLMSYTKDDNKRDLEGEERLNDSVGKDVVVYEKGESAENTSATKKPYRCPFCDLNTKHKYALKRHLKSRHKIIAYKEDIHTDGMMYISGLFDFCNARESTQKPERVKYPICGVYRHDLKLRVKRHRHLGKAYKCNDCNFTSETVDNLLIHARTHEESENERSSNASDDDNTEDVDPLGQDVEKGDPQFSAPIET